MDKPKKSLKQLLDESNEFLNYINKHGRSPEKYREVRKNGVVTIEEINDEVNYK